MAKATLPLTLPNCCRGTSGFVVLALDLQTGQHLAIKFISRGRQHVDVNMKEISRELLVRASGAGFNR